ncbi:MAG: exonuclease SbcCD subunit D [Chloroflexota bacterium]|nr:MAG: exonuclease SbcCD subunit D [Chloroflexota bacterium]
MRPLRLLHFADAHLGVETYGRFDPVLQMNTRLADFTRRLDDIVSRAIDESVDLVVFAGDAYKSRDPSPTHQREFARRIRRLSEADIPTFLLVGNHDLPAASGRASSLDIYDTLAVPRVTVARSLQTHIIETRAGPLQIVALPWLRRSALLAQAENRAMTAEETRRAIEEHAANFIAASAESLRSDVPAILVAHVSVEGAVFGSERSVLVGDDVALPLSSIARPEFRYVALGHIHKHQVLSNDPPTIYPGSIERVDFGEESDKKGFVIAELGETTTWRFQDLPARRFVTIRARAHELDPTGSIVAAISQADVEDAIVRVMVQAEPDVDARVDYATVRRALDGAAMVAGVHRDVARADRRGIGSEGLEFLKPIDALERYLTAREIPETRRAILRQYAIRLNEAAP